MDNTNVRAYIDRLGDRMCTPRLHTGRKVIYHTGAFKLVSNAISVYCAMKMLDWNYILIIVLDIYW